MGGLVWCLVCHTRSEYWITDNDNNGLIVAKGR